MVRIEVLAVGRELLIGRTLDTNVHWVGKRLAAMGSMIKEVTTVDDELGEISLGLRTCISRRPDVLVVMGGLGPTPDDMTLKGVALGLRRKLQLNRAALSIILSHYARRGMSNVELTPARKKMAKIPVGAEPLPNGVGTAPGVKIETGGTTVFCLPGVPSEMKSIFRKNVEPILKKKIGRLYTSAMRFKVELVLESNISPLIGRELKRYPGSYIKSHPRGLRRGVSRIELDVVSVKDEKREAERVCRAIAKDMTMAIEGMGGRPNRVRSLIGGGD